MPRKKKEISPTLIKKEMEVVSEELYNFSNYIEKSRYFADGKEIVLIDTFVEESTGGSEDEQSSD